MPSFIIIAFIAVVIIWLGVLTYLHLKQQEFFKNFTKDVTKKDLKTVLQNIAESLKIASDEVNKLHEITKEIKKADEKHLQKVGFLRYNPFSDTGGDQSFCICLLDQNNHGVIITSLHSREQTRLYAKTVKAGHIEGYELAKEEDIVLKMAMKPHKRSV
jgi:hypothetical protein